MDMFRALLRDALAKEIPLDNIEFEYVPEGDMLRLIVFVTDGVATVSEETVMRSREDLPSAARPRAEAGGSAYNLGLNIFEPDYTSNFSVVTPEIPAPPTVNIAQLKKSGRVVIGENNEENNNSNTESVQEGGVLHSKRKTRRTRRTRHRTDRKNRPLRKSNHD
jgi:hypothetical protein